MAVTVTYATGRGHALIGRALYLPEGCAADEEHRELAGVPEEVMFASKPQLLRLLRDTVIPPPRRDRAHRLRRGLGDWTQVWVLTRVGGDDFGGFYTGTAGPGRSGTTTRWRRQ